MVALIAFFMLRGSDSTTVENGPETTTEDPLDVTIDFYNEWLVAVQSTSTTPVDAGLLASPRLSEGVRTKLEATLNNEGMPDPVLCEPVTPERMGGKVLYALPTEAQIQMLPRGNTERTGAQAVVSLVVQNGAWVISDIYCSTGEVGPEREYSFEQEGYLLKSVPEPLNSDYWHLVFEQNGQGGYTAPLFFDAESICISQDGTEAVCNPDTFIEPAAAYVQAEMTEAGANVKRIQLR